MLKNNKFLISGTSSGLGKFLFQKFNSEKYNRKKEINYYFNNNYKVIIHCAFNKNISYEKDALQLIYDNIFLVQNLINIPHKKFVLISSIDVYEKDNLIHKENEKLKIKSDSSFYSVAKIIQEEIVKKNCNNYLILRPSSMLGKEMRKNTITKILNSAKTKKNQSINLSQNSTLNFVLHEDIYKIIKSEINKKSNSYNIVSSNNLIVSNIAKYFKSSISYGNHLHLTPKVSNKKIINNYNFLNKSSLENLKYFYKNNYDK